MKTTAKTKEKTGFTHHDYEDMVDDMMNTKARTPENLILKRKAFIISNLVKNELETIILARDVLHVHECPAPAATLLKEKLKLFLHATNLVIYNLRQYAQENGREIDENAFFSIQELLKEFRLTLQPPLLVDF